MTSRNRTLGALSVALLALASFTVPALGDSGPAPTPATGTGTSTSGGTGAGTTHQASASKHGHKHKAKHGKKHAKPTTTEPVTGS